MANTIKELKKENAELILQRGEIQNIKQELKRLDERELYLFKREQIIIEKERIPAEAEVHVKKDLGQEFYLKSEKISGNRRNKAKINDKGLNYLLLKSIKNVFLEGREKFLAEFLDEFHEKSFQYTITSEIPMILDESCFPAIRKLEKIGCSREFFQIITKIEMDKILNDIEKINGVDLLANEEKTTNILKFKSPALDDYKFFQENKDEFVKAFLDDVANYLDIKPENINFRNLISGSEEFQISIPEG